MTIEMEQICAASGANDRQMALAQRVRDQLATRKHIKMKYHTALTKEMARRATILCNDVSNVLLGWSACLRVLICGGRNVGRPDSIRDARSQQTSAQIERASREHGLVFAKLDALNASMSFSHVICGSGRGAERLGCEWAELRGLPLTVFRARTGFLNQETLDERNARMIKDGAPQLCVAFGGGAATAGLLELAARAGVKTITIDMETGPASS